MPSKRFNSTPDLSFGKSITETVRFKISRFFSGMAGVSEAEDENDNVDNTANKPKVRKFRSRKESIQYPLVSSAGNWKYQKRRETNLDRPHSVPDIRDPGSYPGGLIWRSVTPPPFLHDTHISNVYEEHADKPKFAKKNQKKKIHMTTFDPDMQSQFSNLSFPIQGSAVEKMKQKRASYDDKKIEKGSPKLINIKPSGQSYFYPVQKVGIYNSTPNIALTSSSLETEKLTPSQYAESNYAKMNSLQHVQSNTNAINAKRNVKVDHFGLRDIRLTNSKTNQQTETHIPEQNINQNHRTSERHQRHTEASSRYERQQVSRDFSRRDTNLDQRNNLNKPGQTETSSRNQLQKTTSLQHQRHIHFDQQGRKQLPRQLSEQKRDHQREPPVKNHHGNVRHHAVQLRRQPPVQLRDKPVRQPSEQRGKQAWKSGRKKDKRGSSETATRRRRMEGREYRVRYLGSSMLTHFSTGLGAVQKALQTLYLAYCQTGGQPSSQERYLRVTNEGMAVYFKDGPEINSKEVKYAFSSIPFCAAVKFTTIRGSDKKLRGAFGPLDRRSGMNIDKLLTVLDKKQHFLTQMSHPPMLVCVLRRNKGVRALDCHAFVCASEEDARNIAYDLQQDAIVEQPNVHGSYDYRPYDRRQPPAVTAPSYTAEVRHSISGTHPAHVQQPSNEALRKSCIPQFERVAVSTSEDRQQWLLSGDPNFDDQPGAVLSDINLDDFTLKRPGVTEHQHKPANNFENQKRPAKIDNQKQKPDKQKTRETQLTGDPSRGSTHLNELFNHPEVQRKQSRPSTSSVETDPEPVGQLGFFFRGFGNNIPMGQDSSTHQQHQDHQQQHFRGKTRNRNAADMYQDAPSVISANPTPALSSRGGGGDRALSPSRLPRAGRTRSPSPRSPRRARPLSPSRLKDVQPIRSLSPNRSRPVSTDHRGIAPFHDGPNGRNSKDPHRTPVHQRPVAKVPPHMRQGVKVLPSDGLEARSPTPSQSNFYGNKIPVHHVDDRQSPTSSKHYEDNWQFSYNSDTDYEYTYPSQEQNPQSSGPSMNDKLLLSQKKDAEIASALSNLHFDFDPVPRSAGGNFEQSLGYFP